MRNASFFLRQDVLRRGHPQQIDAPAIGAYDPEFEAAQDEGLAATRQAAQEVDDQPADGVEVLVAETGGEELVEFRDARVMEAREMNLLAKFGYSNPYA